MNKTAITLAVVAIVISITFGVFALFTKIDADKHIAVLLERIDAYEKAITRNKQILDRLAGPVVRSDYQSGQQPAIIYPPVEGFPPNWMQPVEQSMQFP